MKYDEVMSKVEEVLSVDNNEDYKMSDKYFYYCLGYIDALKVEQVLTNDEYREIKLFILRAMNENKFKEE